MDKILQICSTLCFVKLKVVVFHRNLKLNINLNITQWHVLNQTNTQFTTDFLFISIPYLALSQSILYSHQSMCPYSPVSLIFLIDCYCTPINFCSYSFKVKMSVLG